LAAIDCGLLQTAHRPKHSSRPARRSRHYVPLSVRVLEQFLDVGFLLRADIIKLQHRMKGTREKWRGRSYDFYLIAHKHTFESRERCLGGERWPDVDLCGRERAATGSYVRSRCNNTNVPKGHPPEAV